MKKLINKYKELILYVIFGGMTTLVNLITLKAFNMILGDKRYLISNVIAWLVSVIFAYITNKLFVFESKSWKINVVGKEVFSFFSARVFSLLIEEAGLYLLVDLANLGDKTVNVFGVVIGGIMISKIILAVVVVILNYVFSKLVIFKKKSKE